MNVFFEMPCVCVMERLVVVDSEGFCIVVPIVVCVIIIGTSFGRMRRESSFPRVASKPPFFSIGISVRVICSLVKLLFEKVTVPTPFIGSAEVNAGVAHLGVDDAVAVAIVVIRCSLHEMLMLAPLVDVVVQDSGIVAPSGKRSRLVVVPIVNDVVIASGIMLLFTDTVTDSVWIPLYLPGAIIGVSVSVMLFEAMSLLLNNKTMDPEPGNPFANNGVLQGMSPWVYEDDVVRIVGAQETERLTPSIRPPDHESVYGTEEEAVFDPVTLSMG